MTNTRNNLIQRAVLFLAAASCLLCAGSAAAAQVKEIRIADSGGGDWGYPTPYRHYPRGPGYVRMSMVFDSLLWRDGKGLAPALATAWKYKPGSASWVFTLR